MALTLFQNANIFDGYSSERPEGMSVLVEAQHIKEVSASPITAANAMVIDSADKTHMPGMIDDSRQVYKIVFESQ